MYDPNKNRNKRSEAINSNESDIKNINALKAELNALN